MASLKKLMKTAQAPWTLTSFVRWWWAKLAPICFKKAKKKPKKGLYSTTSPWPCAEFLEVVKKFDASCCCSYYFTVPPFVWFIKAQKSLIQHTCTKMDQFSSPSPVFTYYFQYIIQLWLLHNQIFLLLILSLKSFEYIHIIRWLMNGSQRLNFLYWQIIE